MGAGEGAGAGKALGCGWGWTVGAGTGSAVGAGAGINPPDVDRYSIPLFVTPPFHLSIEALPTCVEPGEVAKHAPMVSGPYLLSRFDGTHNYRNPLMMEGD